MSPAPVYTAEYLSGGKLNCGGGISNSQHRQNGRAGEAVTPRTRDPYSRTINQSASQSRPLRRSIVPYWSTRLMPRRWDKARGRRGRGATLLTDDSRPAPGLTQIIKFYGDNDQCKLPRLKSFRSLYPPNKSNAIV